MNQTKKRLSIINLAISIADTETIQLQILKLSPLKTDIKIQEIIAGLQAENYAQTQALITTYIKTPTEEILQRTAQEAKQLKKKNADSVIEEFDLFITAPSEEEKVEKKIFDFSTFKSEYLPKREQEVIDFDSLLNIQTDDILPGNIRPDIDHTQENTFFDESKYPSEDISKIHIDTEIIPKDTFFDTEEPLSAKEEEKKEVNTNQRKKETIIPLQQDHKKDIQAASSITSPTEKTPSQYKAIPYIDQKFKHLHTQYPPVQESDEEFPSVNAWLFQISNDGYKNDEVEEMITYIAKLAEANSLAEAAQLLLVSGATKSKFAQFMLARALYKGEILQKNLSESFTLIHRLAMDDNYPEAICDLAQFYEHGIGIDKNTKKAEALYKEAMELGIRRAMDHYERTRKQNSSLFSIFKK